MNDYHYDLAGKRVRVAGHTGLVGSAIVRRLESEPLGALITAERRDTDLHRQVKILADVVGWDGEFFYDTSKPDGTPRMRFDVSRIRSLGWTALTDFLTGI